LNGEKVTMADLPQDHGGTVTRPGKPAQSSGIIRYNPDDLPELRKCRRGGEVEFRGRMGVIEKTILSDPYRPQIRVRFYRTADQKQERHNLVVKKGEHIVSIRTDSLVRHAGRPSKF
jgi:hypothetical protein